MMVTDTSAAAGSGEREGGDEREDARSQLKNNASPRRKLKLKPVRSTMAVMAMMLIVVEMMTMVTHRLLCCACHRTAVYLG